MVAGNCGHKWTTPSMSVPIVVQGDNTAANRLVNPTKRVITNITYSQEYTDDYVATILNKYHITEVLNVRFEVVLRCYKL